MTINLPLTGRCQCGATTYEVIAAPRACVACHCKNCQRSSGGAFSVNLIVTADDVRFTGQEPGQFTWTADSGNARAGRFCTSCGCRIAHGTPEWEGTVVIRSGTLDDTSMVRPAANIWLSAKQAWVVPDPATLHFDGNVTDPAAVAAHYAELMAG